MSNAPHATTRTVRLSVWLYKRLLVLYPQPFRQQYGAHMVQVFRDCCREAAYSDGAIGLWRFWLIASGDLVVSALAERRREELPMTRTTWIRLGSLAAIIGGITIALLQIPNTVIAVNMLLTREGLIQIQLHAGTYFQREVWSTTPVIWLLFVLALPGMYARAADRLGAFGRICTVISVIGAALIVIGDTIVAALPLTQGVACVPPTCAYFDFHNYSAIGRIAVFTGCALFLCGMALFSIAAMRQRAMGHGWANILPLVLGILALSSTAILNYPGNFVYLSSPSANLIGFPLLNIIWFHIPSEVPADRVGGGIYWLLAVPLRDLAVMVITSLAFSATWVLMGIALWPRRGDETMTRTVTAPVEPAC
jgi:hypothetical protein